MTSEFVYIRVTFSALLLTGRSSSGVPT